MPALRNLSPILGSYPIPFVTSLISAPTISHKFAISFTYEILSARKSFDAYFIISALLLFVTRIGASKSLYTSLRIFAAYLLSAPITIRDA